VTANGAHYDVVIVGGGVTGAITARRLSERGISVCILEAGPAGGRNWDTYQSYVDNYLEALVKVPNSPYPNPSQVPSPTVLDINAIPPSGPPDSSGYFVQHGPFPFGSDYQRSLGGTTLHWYAHSIRMLPSDFEMRTRYHVGRDWPIGYDDLTEHYASAEREMGVAADVDEQRRLAPFPPDYVFPMQAVPPSYLDSQVRSALAGTTTVIDGQPYPVGVVGLPESRNTIPNPDYDGGAGYTPVGAVGNPTQGLRCEGNSSCIPICPVQAKYSALKTLQVAEDLGTTIITQACVTKIDLSQDGTEVVGLTYARWPDAGGSLETVTADVYVLCAHSVENAKLMLMSGLSDESHQLGRNLMDHPFLMYSALAKDSVGAFRGPGSTSGIETLRDGAFRSTQSAMRCDIDNWGWALNGSPFSDVQQFLYGRGLIGGELRAAIADLVPRQFALGFLLEQLPNPDNRVTAESGYRDGLGLPRPGIRYHIDEYTLRGAAAAQEVARLTFERMNARDTTDYAAGNPHNIEYEGATYQLLGAGHLCGTHRMGDRREESVVDPYQQHWVTRNLFAVGGGSMVTIGTSNPTLTIAALAERSVDAIIEELDHRRARTNRAVSRGDT
jgi:choline dehydrogenase-like flavoprotein